MRAVSHLHGYEAFYGIELINSVDAYSVFATLSIGCISVLYLRLYFLPRDQSRPPFNPPAPIQANEVIYECLSPAEAAAVRLAQRSSTSEPAREVTPLAPGTSKEAFSAPLVNRCYRDECAGRWKPPRTRHCSICRTCRSGFDHHCAIFANCLTAPYIPSFLSLLLCTPPTVGLLISPLVLPLLRRTREAWAIACVDEGIRARWWDWKPSWVVAAGPVGRWAGGLVQGWKALDRMDGGGAYGEIRLKIGVLVFLGLILSAICLVCPLPSR
jgi:palmitoyltransferase